MNQDVREIVEKLFLKVNELPSGFSTSTSKLLEDDCLEKFSTKELFEIHKQLLDKCESQNVGLNFEANNGVYSGLPFNVPFTKE